MLRHTSFQATGPQDVPPATIHTPNVSIRVRMVNRHGEIYRPPGAKTTGSGAPQSLRCSANVSTSQNIGKDSCVGFIYTSRTQSIRHV